MKINKPDGIPLGSVIFPGLTHEELKLKGLNFTPQSVLIDMELNLDSHAVLEEKLISNTMSRFTEHNNYTKYLLASYFISLINTAISDYGVLFRLRFHI